MKNNILIVGTFLAVVAIVAFGSWYFSDAQKAKRAAKNPLS